MADIENIEEYIEEIQTALGGLSDHLGDSAVEFVAEQALNETGFSYPLTGTTKFWGVQRGKRHAIDILRTTAAYKFKYKLISLNQRFDHLDKLIKDLDEVWYTALKTDPVLISIGIDINQTFGTYLGNGFIYDQSGVDRTRLLNDIGEDNDGYRDIHIN